MSNKAVGTVVGGQFHYLSVNHGLADGSGLYAKAQVIVPDAPTQCRHCSSDDLSWEACNTVSNGIQNGLLRTTDVQCLFVLGCNECSETLLRVDADRIADLLHAAPEPSGQEAAPDIEKEISLVVRELIALQAETMKTEWGSSASHEDDLRRRWAVTWARARKLVSEQGDING